MRALQKDSLDSSRAAGRGAAAAATTRAPGLEEMADAPRAISALGAIFGRSSHDERSAQTRARAAPACGHSFACRATFGLLCAGVGEGEGGRGAGSRGPNAQCERRGGFEQSAPTPTQFHPGLDPERPRSHPERPRPAPRARPSSSRSGPSADPGADPGLAQALAQPLRALCTIARLSTTENPGMSGCRRSATSMAARSGRPGQRPRLRPHRHGTGPAR